MNYFYPSRKCAFVLRGTRNKVYLRVMTWSNKITTFLYRVFGQHLYRASALSFGQVTEINLNNLTRYQEFKSCFSTIMSQIDFVCMLMTGANMLWTPLQPSVITCRTDCAFFHPRVTLIALHRLLNLHRQYASICACIPSFSNLCVISSCRSGYFYCSNFPYAPQFCSFYSAFSKKVPTLTVATFFFRQFNA